MNTSLQIKALLAALLLATGTAEAAGLGKMSVLSSLGQPLRVEIELLAVEADELGSLEARLAAPEAFRQARIERAPVLGSLSFAVDKRPGGQPFVRITSPAPMSDPFLDILIELNWNSGRVLREYTVLLDPTGDAKPAAEAPSLPSATPAVTRPAPPVREAVADAKPKAEAEAAKPTEAKAGEQTYGPVKSGETLRAIAGKVLPPDVTLEMMVASLYDANRAAFVRDNMNLLRRGQVLTVPERGAVMLKFSPYQARQLIAQHTQAWQELRGRIAEQAARTEAAAVADTSKSTGRIVEGQVKEALPAVVGRDVLHVSKGDQGRAGKSDAAAPQRIQALEEQLTAKNRALAEAQDRVSQLERTVQDLKQLVQMKQNQAATGAAAASPPAASAAPTVPEATAPITPPPVEKSGWLSALLSNSLYIGGIVAAVVLSIILGVVLLGRRRHQGLSNFEQSVMSGADQLKTSIFKTNSGVVTQGGAASQPGAASEFSRLGLGSIDTHEVDPIAEAEVYMAYGRDAQAEEILKEAHAKDPSRHEVALKLLEIYAARHDTVAFETLASELYANLGGQANEPWLKAAEMGRRIDPENPLYRVFGQVEGVAGGEAVTEPEAAQMQSSTGDGVVIEFDMGENAPAAAAVPAGSAAAAGENPDATDDQPLDFELGDFGVAESFQQERPEVAEALAYADLNPSAGYDQTEDIRIEAPQQSAEESGFSLDIPMQDLDLDLTPETKVAPGPARGEIEVDLSGENLDTGWVPAQSGGEVTLPDLDFSGIDLDLGDVPASAGSETTAQAPGAEIELPVEIDADIREEVNTKLDLAKAYLEMGDQEGAREILQEILKEGDGQQRQEAEKLLAGAA